jgi:hypothetical protein
MYMNKWTVVCLVLFSDLIESEAYLDKLRGSQRAYSGVLKVFAVTIKV